MNGNTCLLANLTKRSIVKQHAIIVEHHIGNSHNVRALGAKLVLFDKRLRNIIRSQKTRYINISAEKSILNRKNAQIFSKRARSTSWPKNGIMA